EIADKEGFPEIAESFRAICRSEEHHEARFLRLAENIKNDTVFKKEKEIVWICSNCGYVHEGNTAPKECPACKHAQSYFQVLSAEY
ncbi:MAG TPA: rubrerythrin family protein, partial [Tenericutes bacterium]|nr:rubrerythrin family protein [Mycoplasmatota bacterium]